MTQSAKKLLSELLGGNLSKSTELAAKQRRLLEVLGSSRASSLVAPQQEVDELEMEHQQRMADAVAEKLSFGARAAFVLPGQPSGA